MLNTPFNTLNDQVVDHARYLEYKEALDRARCGKRLGIACVAVNFRAKSCILMHFGSKMWCSWIVNCDCFIIMATL